MSLFRRTGTIVRLKWHQRDKKGMIWYDRTIPEHMNDTYMHGHMARTLQKPAERNRLCTSNSLHSSPHCQDLELEVELDFSALVPENQSKL